MFCFTGHGRSTRASVAIMVLWLMRKIGLHPSFGGRQGDTSPHVLKGGGHNIKRPPTFFELVCVSPQKSYILINLD